MSVELLNLPSSIVLIRSLIEGDDEIIDQVNTTFGFRQTRFDVNHGFFLNGKSRKILGTCNHQVLFSNFVNSEFVFRILQVVEQQYQIQ